MVVAAVWAASTRPWALGAQRLDAPWQAPEFTHTAAEAWINSPPVTLAALEGRVVVLDFWTWGCWNCRRSVPWLRELARRFPDELAIVGVHTPEFKHEMDPAGVRRQVAELGLDHPVMLDNDFSYWEAMGTRYWPTFYLIDKAGRVREKMVGEVLPNGNKAGVLEDRIRALMAETT